MASDRPACDRHLYACALARAATEDRPTAVALELILGEPLSVLALSQTRQLSVPRQAADARAARLSAATASA